MKVAALLTVMLAGSVAVADIVEVEAFQTGDFYDGGTKDNSPTFQNYFVGYGTTTGSPRTPERRSFFWFKLDTIPDGEIVGATLSLETFRRTYFRPGTGDTSSTPAV